MPANLSDGACPCARSSRGGGVDGVVVALALTGVDAESLCHAQLLAAVAALSGARPVCGREAVRPAYEQV